MTFSKDNAKQLKFDSESSIDDLQNFFKEQNHLKNSLESLTNALSKLIISENLLANKEKFSKDEIDGIIKKVFYNKN